MRILTVGNMYPPHHLGGYEIAWHSWAAHARREGAQVDVLTTTYRRDDPDPAFPEDPQVDRSLPWYWHDHEFPPLGAGEVLSLERRAQRQLAGHLDPVPDVVCWWAMGGMSMSLVEAVRRRGIPSVFVIMDDWCIYGPKVDRWQRAMDRPVVRRIGERFGIPVGFRADASDQWIFLSRFLRDRIRDAGVDPPRAGIAGRGPDPADFPPSEPRPWQGELVCVGRLEQRKGQHVAIAALGLLPDCRLTLVGPAEPQFLRSLEGLADEHGVADRVTFTSPGRDRLAAAYADADAVLFPVQWDEPWGFVPLEAMSVGRPVVATASGGSAEYLRDGENCLVYAPRDDPKALAAAVARLAGDQGLRESLRSQGSRTAAGFTEDAFNRAVSGAVDAAVQ